MLDDIIVRRLVKNDINDFFDLRLESLQAYPESFLTSYEEEKISGAAKFEKLLTSNSASNVIFGAFIKDNLIGIVGIYKNGPENIAHKCNLWGLYVKHDWRKSGAGKLLIQAVIQYAREKMQCQIIDLTVAANNYAAKNLYELYGFKAWGNEIKAIYVNGKFYDEIHMSLLF